MDYQDWLKVTDEWGFFLENPRPILNEATIALLENHLKEKSPASVLETGSGASTIWFAQRASRVLAFEDYRVWLARTLVGLSRLPTDYCDVEIRYEWNYSFRGFRRVHESFDVVLIDGSDEPGARVETMKVAHRYVNPEGLLIVDDAQREWYKPGLDALDNQPWFEKTVLTGPDFKGDEHTVFVYRRG